MSEAKHTPLPWRVGPYGGIYPLAAGGPGIVSGLTKSGYLPNWEANEAFIVAAVNTRPAVDGLVEALEEMRELVSGFSGGGCRAIVKRADLALKAYKEA